MCTVGLIQKYLEINGKKEILRNVVDDVSDTFWRRSINLKKVEKHSQNSSTSANSMVDVARMK